MTLTSSHKAAIALFLMLLPSITSAVDYTIRPRTLTGSAILSAENLFPPSKTIYLSDSSY